MSERRKIILAFSVSIFILALIGVFAYKNTNDYKNSINWVSHTQEVISQTEKLLSEIQVIESGTRGYVITGNEEYLESYKEDLKNIENTHLSIKDLIKDNPSQQVLLNSIHSKIISKIDFTKKIISIRQKEGFQNAQQLVSTNIGKNLMQEIRVLTHNFINNENKLLSVRIIDAKQKFSLAINIIIASIVITLIIVLTTMWSFMLGYNKRIQSQKEFKNFMDLSIDLIIIANVNGLFHIVSPSLTKLLGYTKEEIEGTPFIDYIHPDDLEKTYKEVEKLAQGELTLSFENRYRKKDGEYVLLSWKTTPDVETGQLYCVARDITLEKIKEKNLVDTTNELKAILNSSDFSIIAIGLDGIITEFNKGAEKLLGYKAEEVVGKFSSEIIHLRSEIEQRAEELTLELGETIVPGYDVFAVKARRYGVADSREWTYVRKDGSTFPVLSSITAIKDHLGKTTGYLGIAKDITAEKEAELKLKSSSKLLDESEQMAKIGSWRLDLNTKEVIWSKGHYRIYEVNEYAALNIREQFIKRLSPEDVLSIDQLVEQTIKTGEGFHFSHKVLFPDGRFKYVFIIGEAVKNEKDEIIAVQGTIQDITEKTLNEEKIYEKTKEIRDIRSALDEGAIVSITDQNGIFTYVNDNFCAISKYSKEELLGNNQRIISDFLPKHFTSKVLNTIMNGKIWKGEIRNIAKDGSYYWENTIIVPFLDEEGKPYQYITLSNNITKNKLQEEELINARNLAEVSAKAKEQFLTNMSHEIRTPMNGVLGFARILADTKLDKNQKQSVAAIKKAGENLMVIINDILDFSKIEADKMVFEDLNFSLSNTIMSVIELVEPKAKDQQIDLKLEINPEINDALIGDPTRLSQILLNLVGNAIKFTSKGSVRLIVTQTEETDSFSIINFAVVDTGIGIPKNKLVSIFESFNQASNETSRKYGGTGLGLTITRKLIELQQGKINVKSEVGKGSEFSFTLKYKKDNKAKNKVKTKKIAKLSPAFLKGLKILMAEDHILNQLLATKIFEKWNKKIDIADNGKIALEKIEKNHYDIILMDLQMPEMDGYELTKHIRENLKSNVPIIAISAHARLGEEQKCLDLAMDDYLSKPFDPTKLLEKMHQNIFKNEYDEQEPPLDIIVDSEHLINLKNLNEFAEGDPDFTNQIIAMFIINTPESIEKILKANDEDDVQVLKAEVHKLKSSLGLFGIAKGLAVLNFIEEELINNPIEKSWKNEIKNLEAICNEAIKELQAMSDK